jgi:hypothetical protein
MPKERSLANSFPGDLRDRRQLPAALAELLVVTMAVAPIQLATAADRRILLLAACAVLVANKRSHTTSAYGLGLTVSTRRAPQISATFFPLPESARAAATVIPARLDDGRCHSPA